MVDGEVTKNKTYVSADQATTFSKKWALKLGAIDVGVTLLKDYQKYSVVNRGDNYGKTVELNHKFAIAFTVEMDKEMMDSAPHAPTVLETVQ